MSPDYMTAFGDRAERPDRTSASITDEIKNRGNHGKPLPRPKTAWDAAEIPRSPSRSRSQAPHPCRWEACKTRHALVAELDSQLMRQAGSQDSCHAHAEHTCLYKAVHAFPRSQYTVKNPALFDIRASLLQYLKRGKSPEYAWESKLFTRGPVEESSKTQFILVQNSESIDRRPPSRDRTPLQANGSSSYGQYTEMGWYHAYNDQLGFHQKSELPLQDRFASPNSCSCSFQDPELWFPSGDCLVHFYAQGHSRRGASLRVSLAAIESSNCGPLLDRFSARANVESPSTASDRSSSTDEDYFNDPSPPAKHELFIPAPSGLTKEGAFSYHVTTRNFFAWMFEKPLVGHRLGDSLLSLLDRMNEFRASEDENLEDILAYLDSQEYTDFRSCPDHALAVLQFAERHELLELWRDSFCHCAGMSEDLEFSAEYEFVSRQSKALIMRAHLEMDLRLEHAGRSLGNFLEDELSGAYLGLSPAARNHLDRFRSFLHSFYVGKYGYWPPSRSNPASAALPKSTFKAMYFEFRNLYEYLVDPTSGTDLQSDRPADGGICVYQNVSAFDKRKKYTSLPHPLPLVPESSILSGRQKTGTVRKLFKYSQAQKIERRTAALAALSAATNPSDIKVMECGLVREYLRFEKSWTLQEKDESVSCSDARKVRWILIYAVLQTLISVTRAPAEVRDTEGIPYPLCCQIAGTPPWDEDGKKAAQKKAMLKQKLITMGEEEMRRVKALQDQHPCHQPSQPVQVPETRRVAFTTPFLGIQPDHADLFIPKPMPLFSSSLPNNRNTFSNAPPPYPPPPVPSTRSTPSSPTRPRALTLPQKVILTRDLSVRSPQPRRPGFVDSLIHKYSRERLPHSSQDSPAHSTSNSTPNSRGNSAPSSGNSSPGGASLRRGNASPISSTPASSSAREEDSSAWSESSNDDEDAMEHGSVCGSVSSKYDVEEGIVVLDDIKPAVIDRVKRWDSVRSVGQLGRSNPEVDAYVWGVAR
ncbi:MAG: hypothetical protein Q9216_003735 [Gyalolechia sp. 2 TL-2023]